MMYVKNYDVCRSTILLCVEQQRVNLNVYSYCRLTIGLMLKAPTLVLLSHSKKYSSNTNYYACKRPG